MARNLQHPQHLFFQSTWVGVDRKRRCYAKPFNFTFALCEFCRRVDGRETAGVVQPRSGIAKGKATHCVCSRRCRRAAIRVESTSSLPTTRSEFPDAVKLLDRRQVFFFIFYDFLYAFNILRFKVDVVKWAWQRSFFISLVTANVFGVILSDGRCVLVQLVLGRIAQQTYTNLSEDIWHAGISFLTPILGNTVLYIHHIYASTWQKCCDARWSSPALFCIMFDSFLLLEKAWSCILILFLMQWAYHSVFSAAHFHPDALLRHPSRELRGAPGCLVLEWVGV